jgi:CcmD family protein
MRHAAVLVLLAAILAVATPGEGAPRPTNGELTLALSVQQPAAPPRTPVVPEGFEPVGDRPPAEQLPAAPFVMAAYAFVWVALLGYLWSIWRRLGAVERELADLTRRIEDAGRRA